ncbi:MAG: DUF3604 domain-containing protein, partial [Arenicella sp.]|nr:DUF3604 domain-containing protein [Arenicella sp.]
VMQSLLDGNEELTKDPQLARWSEMMAQGPKQAQQAAAEIIKGLANNTLPEAISDPAKAAKFAKAVWQDYLSTAERFNDPGRFTSLIGYEFSSQPKGDNMHRVVVFADGADKAGQILPFSSLMSADPEDLWRFLHNYEQKTGGSVLAIPHNPNLSNGRMFALVDFEGSAIDAEYAGKRKRWEPLVEATQIKGDSEAHPFLSPNDEFAAFGNSGWEEANLTLQTAKTDEMLGGEYVREGLKRGLMLNKQTGVNPFKFGLIGSTDSHTALATGAEDNFFGKNTPMEPREGRVSHIFKKSPIAQIAGWQYLAGGYAAVWATENTRRALFEAMRRKEVYATTGSRIRLRFFGGFEFTEEMQSAANIAQHGYKLGVPMGSDLIASGNKSAPGFLVHALKDPQGRNLSRIQIIKGWLDAEGDLHEQIYDIAESENEAGSSELSAYWLDADFDSGLDAFYYARILEVPGMRWPAYDAERFGIEIPEQAQKLVRERAYSSPIWYQP